MAQQRSRPPPGDEAGEVGEDRAPLLARAAGLLGRVEARDRGIGPRLAEGVRAAEVAGGEGADATAGQVLAGVDGGFRGDQTLGREGEAREATPGMGARAAFDPLLDLGQGVLAVVGHVDVRDVRRGGEYVVDDRTAAHLEQGLVVRETRELLREEAHEVLLVERRLPHEERPQVVCGVVGGRVEGLDVQGFGHGT